MTDSTFQVIQRAARAACKPCIAFGVILSAQFVASTRARSLTIRTCQKGRARSSTPITCWKKRVIAVVARKNDWQRLIWSGAVISRKLRALLAPQSKRAIISCVTNARGSQVCVFFQRCAANRATDTSGRQRWFLGINVITYGAKGFQRSIAI